MTTGTPPGAGQHFRNGAREIGAGVRVLRSTPGRGLSGLWARKWTIGSYFLAALVGGYVIFGGDDDTPKVDPNVILEPAKKQAKKIVDDAKDEASDIKLAAKFDRTFVAAVHGDIDLCSSMLAKDKDGTQYVIANLDVTRGFSQDDYYTMVQRTDGPYPIRANVRAAMGDKCDPENARLFATPRRAWNDPERRALMWSFVVAAREHNTPGTFLVHELKDCGGPYTVVKGKNGKTRCSPTDEAIRPGEVRLPQSHHDVLAQFSYGNGSKTQYTSMHGVVNIVRGKERYLDLD